MANDFVFQMIGCEKILPSGRKILDPTWLSFYPDAKIGVIGHNGSGKSTLLRLMSGQDTEYNGQMILKPGSTVGFLPQEPKLDETLDVRGNVELGLKHWRELLLEFDAVSNRMGEDITDDEMDRLISRQAELQDKIDAAGAWEMDRTLDVAMDALRVPPADWAVKNLSGGERRRVALCRLLLEKPDLLLLDEPTNHLDAESVSWLERFLAEYAGCVITVTHDRYFLDNVSKWILELDHGKGYPFEGNYSGWLEQKQERMRQEKKAESDRARAMGEELEWIRQSPRARQAKSKARISAYEQLVANEAEARRGVGARIHIPLTRRLGGKVIEVEGLTKAYGDKLLFENLSFKLPPGGIVGVIGANGAGKTTLFRILLGAEQPDGGKVTHGETVDLAYVDQSRDALNDNKTVWEEISGGHDLLKIGGKDVNSRAYVSLFNFTGSDQQQKVGTLSGGERNRVHLAKLLKTGGNLLFLDEPTNDLDVETLRNLEEALTIFPGCAVVISHDRFFLDRIATHILAFEGDSQVVWFEGNYQDYERDRKRRLGADADQPHRIKYKKLTR
ncbi:MAG: energy-dependent translational throttle protein EttA [Deltaproteobacteria bacterium]|nr:energy-dependent translational throttle protein EttA [Deltaproteobacteria bacterium]